MAETKLKRISVRGFRSIKECVLDLGDVNVLIGPNGSGKSNLVSIFYLLQNITGKNLQYYVAKNGISSLLFKGPKVTNRIEMEFVFDQNSYGFVLEVNGEGRLVFADEYYGWDGGHWPLDRTPNGYESEFENGLPNLITKYVKPVLQAKKWRVYHFHDTTYT